jgi:hypothetical protein
MSAHLSRAVAIPQFCRGARVSLRTPGGCEPLLPLEASHRFRLTYTHLLAALVAQALKNSTPNAS